MNEHTILISAKNAMRCFFVTTLLIVGHWAGAQMTPNNPLHFTHLSKANGLSHNNVTSMLQDRDGFYWIGTFNGLNRFDGSNFQHFFYNEYDSTTLSHNHVLDLAEDNEGNIWVGTMRGLSKFDKQTGKFIRFLFQTNKTTDELANRIYNVVKDFNGDIWCSSRGLRRIRPSDQRTLYIEFNEQNNAGLSSFGRTFFYGYDEKLKGIWLYTNGDVNFYNIADNVFYHKKHNPKGWQIFDESTPELKNVIINNEGLAAFVYDENKLIVFDALQNRLTKHSLPFKSSVGVALVNSDSTIAFPMAGDAIAQYDFLKQKTSYTSTQLPNDYIANRYACIDIKNAVKKRVLLTVHGVFIAHSASTPAKNYHINTIDNKPLFITHILSDKQNVWMASAQGLFHFNTLTKEIKKVSLGETSDNGVVALLHYDSEILCLGSHTQLLFFNKRTNKVTKRVPVAGSIIFLNKDPAGNIWVGFWRDGLAIYSSEGVLLSRYTTDNGLKYNRLVCCLPDGDKGLWVGMNEGNGFFRIDYASRTIKNYIVNTKSVDGPNSNNINAIFQRTDTELWLGTYGGGVFVYNLKSGEARKISQSDGLLCNYIDAIKADVNGNIWVSTPDGVSIVSPKDYSVKQTPVKYVSSNNDYTNNFCKATNSDAFYFTSLNTITELSSNYYNSPSPTTKVLLSDCQVFDQQYFYAIKNKELILPHDQNFIELTYSAMKDDPSQTIQYGYKIVGIDRGWNYTTQTKINYKNLPPGKYAFIIKATNEVGDWIKEETLLNITIRPPFWKTWWFYLLSTLAAIAAINAFIQYRIRQVKKVFVLQQNLHQMQQKISDDLHDNIGASLSSINILSEVVKQKMKNEDSSVNAVVDKISETSVEVINEMKDTIWFINPQHQSFDFVVSRLRQYAEPICSEMEIQFQLIYTSHPALESLSLFSKKNIYLIAREAINNSLKYAAAKKIAIEFVYFDGGLLLKVEDDGIGIPTEYTPGNGIKNMHQRTVDLGGTFQLKRELKGTRIIVKIPLSNDNDH
jgi:sugar lactone lactonase YvrE